jgi:hypothetical protein
LLHIALIRPRASHGVPVDAATGPHDIMPAAASTEGRMRRVVSR